MYLILINLPLLLGGGEVFLHYGVELRGGHGALAVGEYLYGFFKHLVDTLLGDGRCEDDGEVGEGCKALADGCFVVLDGRGALVFHEVPFVYNYHEAFLVALDD